MAIIETPERIVKKTRKQDENRLQAKCMTWFKNNYKQYALMTVLVLNEAAGSMGKTPQERAKIGAEMKAKGLTEGTSDNLILVPKKGYHGLCPECKVKGGCQSKDQKEWQKHVEYHGYYYFLYWTFEEFVEKIKWYFDE